MTTCLPGFYIGPDRLSCVDGPDFCLTVNVVDPLLCDVCIPDLYYWDPISMNCIDCFNMDVNVDCNTCTHGGTCLTCLNAPDEIVQVDGKTCVYKSWDCLVLDPTNYENCVTCNDGFFEFFDGTLTMCSNCNFIAAGCALC